MTKFTIKSICLAAALGVSASAAAAAPVYSDMATDFQGQYRGVETLDVEFDATGGTNALSFDLFGANSVDGFGNGWDDLFTVLLNGTEVFSGYFSLSGGGANVIGTNLFGWAVTVNTNPGDNFQGGVAKVSGFANLLQGSNTFSVTFSSPGPNNGGGQPLSDESWALNDLDVVPVPLPAALPLLGVALAGLGLAARRRRS